MCDCQFDVMDTKKLTINQSQNAYLKLIYINRAHKCRTDLGNSTERTITRCVSMILNSGSKMKITISIKYINAYHVKTVCNTHVRM